MLGRNLMGFHEKEPEEIPHTPNRAERRAMAKKLKAKQRRGQRAWERTQKEES